MTALATFLIRAGIALGLTAAVLHQMDITPVAVLVIAFLVTVVWSPLTRKEVF